MTSGFRSILWLTSDEHSGRVAAEPDFFADLNLDQIASAATAGRGEYDLVPFFHAPLQSLDAVRYRQEIVRDLESPALRACLRDFAGQMRAVRDAEALIEKLYHQRQKEAWFRDAVETYCAAVRTLSEALGPLDLQSRGFRAFRDFIADHVSAPSFTSLVEETRAVAAGLAEVTYCLHIDGSRVTVRRYGDEPDYSTEIAATFEKFKQGDVKARRFKFSDETAMNDVEANIAELVARLFPETFDALRRYRAQNADFLDPVLRAFDREVQFYLGYLDHVKACKAAGLAFCLPEVSDNDKEISCEAGFDLALARKLVREGQPIVTNDFRLAGAERVLVVSGPNQGGKTTFARMFGQLHYLASLGLPVPGKAARLYLCDRLFTHFEREEDMASHSGKLQDDLVRIHQILEETTPRSIVLMNEIFTSTALEDALFLSERVIETIVRLDALCVCVTFIDELSTLAPQTVSMVSTVIADNPAERTFKILRRPADGLAHAMFIAEKHGVTRKRILERLSS